jgi:hypothetical protein
MSKMTKPIAERYEEAFRDVDSWINKDELFDWLKEQEPLFTLEEVEQIAREAVAKCYVVSEVDPNCELHCNSEFPIEWWAKKKQLLEKQGK